MSTIAFAGNLAAEPEIRFTPSGAQVAKFTVIENRRRKTEDGKGWEDAEPNAFRVQAWDSLAVNIAESVHKGDRVMVEGSVVTDRWTDKDSNQERTAQHIRADEVAFSLKFHTVTATKAPRAQSDDAGESTEPQF